MDATLETAGLLLRAHLEPVLEQDDPGIDPGLLHGGYLLEESLGLLRRAEPHHTLDARPVVPAPVEDDDLAGRREMLDVALDVHLRLLALGRGSQRDHLEDTGTD